MTRRVALQLVGTVVGYIYGTPVVDTTAAPAQSPRGLALVLDGLDGIVLQYRGQRVVIAPADVMAALTPEMPPAIYQQQRAK